MKKRLLLLLLLSIGITGLSYGDSLDDWSDDSLCGWMENPPPHSFICEGPLNPPIVPPIRPGWKIL